MSSRHEHSAPRCSSQTDEEATLLPTQECDDHPYRDPERLRAVYDRVGTIVDTAAHFEIAEATARTWLIRYDLYDPETDGLPAPSEELEQLAPEELGLPPLGERQ